MYDDANRIDTVDSVAYSFDANGNLLDDGVNTYTYDPANRLSTVDGPSPALGVLGSAVYVYDGLGDRLQQTVDEETTTYTLDLATGLTQVLDDGTNTYLYGNGRIAQVNTGTEYFLGDALGSVRQMTDGSGVVKLARAYDPYGVTRQDDATRQTMYGFTGEPQDANTNLVYLRSRFYSADMGRFMSRDTWDGDANKPISFNRWAYVYANPINLLDPSGHIPSYCFYINPSNWPNIPECSDYIPSTPPPSGYHGWPSIDTSLFTCPLSSVTSAPGTLQYDLTGYLALAMSRHGADVRVMDIGKSIYNTSGTANDYLFRFIGAYWDFYNLEGGNQEWDIKVKIQEDLGDGIVLCGTTCDWFDYSTPGNIHFGYVAYRAKIDQGIAAIAGGVLKSWGQFKDSHSLPDMQCFQIDARNCDDPDDQAAVDFGYYLAKKYSGGLSEANLRAELTASVMANLQHPPAGFPAPHPAYSEYNDYYGADHFNY